MHNRLLGRCGANAAPARLALRPTHRWLNRGG